VFACEVENTSYTFNLLDEQAVTSQYFLVIYTRLQYKLVRSSTRWIASLSAPIAAVLMPCRPFNVLQRQCIRTDASCHMYTTHKVNLAMNSKRTYIPLPYALHFFLPLTSPSPTLHLLFSLDRSAIPVHSLFHLSRSSHPIHSLFSSPHIFPLPLHPSSPPSMDSIISSTLSSIS
jgi:hypothetical protein